MNNSNEDNMGNGTTDITSTGITFWKYVISNIKNNFLTNNDGYIKKIIPLNTEEAENYVVNFDFLLNFFDNLHTDKKVNITCIEPILYQLQNDQLSKGSKINIEDIINYGIKILEFIQEKEYSIIKIVDDILTLLNEHNNYKEIKVDNYLTKFSKEIENKCSSLISKNMCLLIMRYVKNGDIKRLDKYLERLKVNQSINAVTELKVFIDGLKIAYNSIYTVQFKSKDTNTDKKALPIIKTMKDLHIQKPDIIKYVEKYKDEDHIFFIKNGGRHEIGTYKQGQFEVKSDFYIAGSAALNKLITDLSCRKYINNAGFNPGDTDIFIVGNDRKFRSQFNGTDIIHTRDKSIEDLLLNFDLPCCRVATNPNGDYWISLQCIYALHTNKYFLPEYLNKMDTFSPLIHKYPGEEFKNLSMNQITESSNFLFKRLHERITKYKNRNFQVNYYKTDIVLPWIIHRIDYTEPTMLLE